MAFRDKLLGFGRVAATAAADALLDWAETSSFQKAEPGKKQPGQVDDEEQEQQDAPSAAPTATRAGDRRNDLDDESGQKAPGGRQQESSTSDPVPTDKAGQNPKSLFADPFAIIEQLGYKEKPTAVTYNTLKLIMWRMPVCQAVVATRINQVANFCKPSHDRYSLGFRIKLRESEKEPSAADKKWALQMENLIQRTGVTDNPRGRGDLEQFLRKLTWDSLVYDQACFEVVPNRRGQPAEWYAVDASTIRLADTARVYMNEDLSNAVRFVQIYDSMIVAEYTQEELAFGIRNPRTDIKLHGYGVSELEILIQTITAFLNSWDYNAKAFTQGSAAKGLLNFKGAINETQLKAFRRHWYQMISGVENAWRTPITNAEDVQWINMGSSNRDMEYNAWMDFLIKLTCSVYSMDPVEVNFKYGNTGQKGGLNESNNREKITESKERGLRPLLGHLAGLINRNIVWPINENFEFAFVGLDAQTREDAAKLQQTQVKTYRTVDEIRAEEDLPPLPDGTGEIILDPVFLQNKQAAAQAEQQAQMAAQGGMPGQLGPNGEPDFEALLNGQGDDGQDQQGDDGEGNPFAGKQGGDGADAPAKPAQAAKPAGTANPRFQNPNAVQKSMRPARRPVRLDIKL